MQLNKFREVKRLEGEVKRVFFNEPTRHGLTSPAVSFLSSMGVHSTLFLLQEGAGGVAGGEEEREDWAGVGGGAEGQRRRARRSSLWALEREVEIVLDACVESKENPLKGGF